LSHRRRAEFEARKAILGSLDPALGELVEADAFEMNVSLAAAGQLDDVGDERGQLFQLG
jgi:hypothetical protein